MDDDEVLTNNLKSTFSNYYLVTVVTIFKNKTSCIINVLKY